MKVRLAYGRSGLETDFPDEAVVVAPEHRDAAADQMAALRRALREPVAGPPLREQVKPGQTVAISACDGTRPQPRQLMIPAVLDELDGIVRPEDITVLVATGTHRANTRDELVEMFGAQTVDRVRIVNHDARDDSTLQWVGTFGEQCAMTMGTERDSSPPPGGAAVQRLRRLAQKGAFGEGSALRAGPSSCARTPAKPICALKP